MIYTVSISFIIIFYSVSEFCVTTPLHLKIVGHSRQSRAIASRFLLHRDVDINPVSPLRRVKTNKAVDYFSTWKSYRPQSTVEEIDPYLSKCNGIRTRPGDSSIYNSTVPGFIYLTCGNQVVFSRWLSILWNGGCYIPFESVFSCYESEKHRENKEEKRRFSLF